MTNSLTQLIFQAVVFVAALFVDNQTERRRPNNFVLYAVVKALSFLVFLGIDTVFGSIQCPDVECPPTVFDHFELSNFEHRQPMVPFNLTTSKPRRTIEPFGTTFVVDDLYVFTHGQDQHGKGNIPVPTDISPEDVAVVKTVFPYERCLMSEAYSEIFNEWTTFWPREIPTEVLLACFRPGDDPASLSLRHRFFQADPVPAPDHLLVKVPEPRAFWSLVVPLLVHGDPLNVAPATRSKIPRSPHELDLLLRPAFNHLLSSLSTIHANGYCHDDIQPASLFVYDRLRWLSLGPVDDPYRPTPARHRENQWPDCRLNDVRNALRAYMALLRRASPDARTFDTQFHARRQPWSKLYWDFMRRPVHADRLLAWQESEAVCLAPQRGHAPAAPPRQRRLSGSWGALGKAVEWDLTLTVAGELSWEGWKRWESLRGAWRLWPLRKMSGWGA